MRFLRMPPLFTVQIIFSLVTSLTTSEIIPSSSSSSLPIALSPSLKNKSTSFGKEIEVPFSSPSAFCSLQSAKDAPSTSFALPSLNVPTLTSGPFVSSKIATFLPLSLIASLRTANVTSRSSYVPWDILMRATFIPASIILSKVSLVLQAGPIVHTILVFLI